ncbi:MAG: hypothetical protein HQM09_20805 [Candidatus Riflebacteria bacterium]|nr:hypothetical protein [Candidatus Riflebacteria bacterium]
MTKQTTTEASIPKIGFEEVWQIDVGSIRMMQATASGTAITILSTTGTLFLIDHHGKTLATTEIGSDARTISMSENMETLVVTENGFTHLYDGEGKLLFKKRIVAAMNGLISPSGKQLVFVTRDPTVVLTDRVGRVKWTYRNLLRIPTAIDVSGEGQCVVFGCRDDCGDGIAAVGIDGTHFDAFMGLDSPRELAVNSAGDIVVALDKAHGIYCFNCVKSFGIWKGQLSSDFNGVSYADDTGETLVYAKEGLLSLLDVKGTPIWEYRFDFPLLRACISSDGRTIFYASPAGKVGCLSSKAARDLTHMEFIDVSPPATSSATTEGVSLSFKKAWIVDFEQASPVNTPRLRCFRSVDGVEYLTLWYGRDQLSLFNDCGEEVWNNRLSFGSLLDMSVSPAADTILTIAKQGVIAFNLNGEEIYRFVSAFRTGHSFASGAFIMLDDHGQVCYFPNASHRSQILKLQDTVLAIFGHETGAYLVCRGGVFIINSTASIIGAIKLAGNANFFDIDPIENSLMIGTSTGEFTIIDHTGSQKLRNQLDATITAACFHPIDETLYIACHGQQELLILRTRDNRRIHAHLTTSARHIVAHEYGAIVATAVDEVCLINIEGIIVSRYTFPDRIMGLFPARTRNAIYVLAETTLTCLAVTDGSTPVTTGARYVEL